MKHLWLLLVAALLTSCTPSTSSVTPAPVTYSAKKATTLGDFMGCPYPSGDVWQTNISKVSKDPNSDAYLKAVLDAGGSGGLVTNGPTTDEELNLANSSTPSVTVHPRVKYHTPYTPEKWASSFYIEPLSDAHALVLDTDACNYYESYETSWDGTALTEQNGCMYALEQPWQRPATSCSTASGIPFGLLAVRPEELTAGSILHALGWDAVQQTLSQTACVNPAGVTDCTDDLPYKGPASDTPMPYGTHVRLKGNFNISTFPREAKIIATALKRYGAYVYDTGCCNTIVMIGKPVWTSSDSTALKTITPANFQVVPAPQ